MGRLLGPGVWTWDCILPAVPGSRYAGKSARDFNRLPARKPDSAQSLKSGSFRGPAVFFSVTYCGIPFLKGG